MRKDLAVPNNVAIISRIHHRWSCIILWSMQSSNTKCFKTNPNECPFQSVPLFKLLMDLTISHITKETGMRDVAGEIRFFARKSLLAMARDWKSLAGTILCFSISPETKRSIVSLFNVSQLSARLQLCVPFCRRWQKPSLATRFGKRIRMLNIINMTRNVKNSKTVQKCQK